MIITLKTHLYAPELNTAYLGKNGVQFRAPGLTTIKEVRKKYFASVRPGRFVVVGKQYDDPAKKWLNNRAVYTGYGTLSQVKEAMRRVDKTLAPGGRVTVKTRLIG